MKRSDYKPLGDYIALVNERNRDLTITHLVGVSIEKKFIPSIANIIGTDLSPYKIIRHNQFAYGPVTSRNGEKITIALYKDTEDGILSQAYEVFRIKDEEVLMPEYLMLWVQRPEFDRYARFKSHGSVREIFSWEEMCNVMLPVPPIAEQRKIVKQYQTIERRIKNNEALIQKLEATAQALYHHTFVEGIDKENLPEGWRMGVLSDIMQITSGKTAIDKVETKTDVYQYPVAGASGTIGYSSHYNTNDRIITTGRVGTLGVVRKYNEPIWCADNVLIANSQQYEYSFMLLKHINYEEILKGGVQALITQSELNNYPILLPNPKVLTMFEKKSSVISQIIHNFEQENVILQKMMTLTTSKLS